MTENVTAFNETTTNTLDTSIYRVPFEENPDKELQDFIEISERNLEAFEDDNQEILSLFHKGGDWNKYRELIDKVELFTKEINTGFEIEKIEAEGEIDYCKKRLPVVQDDIETLKSLIHDCDIKINKLQKEKSDAQEKIKDKHSAFQQAIKYYKFRFNVYVNVTKSGDAYYKDKVQICFFTQKFDDTYSATLLLHDGDNKNKEWKLENVKSGMHKSIIEKLQRRLKETNDINEIICVIRNHLQNNIQ